MSKCYDRCPLSVEQRAAALIAKHHEDLGRSEVKIDFIFCSDENGPALKLHGVQCAAIVKILSLKDRAKGLGDAEILIDRDLYNGMSDAGKDALLDHELHHLMIRFDADGNVATDDQHRPKLAMRPHDWDFGWFNVIAQRHGDASLEVQQARKIWDKAGQVLFPFALADARV